MATSRWRRKKASSTPLSASRPLGALDRGQHDRLDVVLHDVHRGVDDPPFELGEKSLVTVQLGKACPPEAAVEVEPRQRAARTRDDNGYVWHGVRLGRGVGLLDGRGCERRS